MSKRVFVVVVVGWVMVVGVMFVVVWVVIDCVGCEVLMVFVGSIVDFGVVVMGVLCMLLGCSMILWLMLMSWFIEYFLLMVLSMFGLLIMMYLYFVVM